MPKKGKFMRLSEDVIASLEKYKADHELKTEDEALRLIFQRLQYLEDLALEQKQQQQSENPIEWLNDNPCPYRTLIKEKDGFSILCHEKHKLPLQACMTRQKRYQQFDRKCRPIDLENKKRWQKRADTKTRKYKDEFERAYYPDDYFHDDWGVNI